MFELDGRTPQQLLGDRLDEHRPNLHTGLVERLIEKALRFRIGQGLDPPIQALAAVVIDPHLTPAPLRSCERPP